MSRPSLFIVGILWVLVFLSQSTESYSWWYSSSGGSKVDSSVKAALPEPEDTSDHDIGAELSIESFNSEEGRKLVEDAQRQIALPNSCSKNAYRKLLANCTEIQASEKQRYRLAWDLSNCYQKDTGRPPFRDCDPKSSLKDCTKRLSEYEHGIYTQFVHQTNIICQQLQFDEVKRKIERLVNKLITSSKFAESKLKNIERSAEFSVNKLESIERSAEFSVNKLESIERSAEFSEKKLESMEGHMTSIDAKTQEIAQTSKNAEEHVKVVLDQSLKIADTQMELQAGQTKMSETLDEGLTTLNESANKLGENMIKLGNEVVELEKEIVQVGDAVSMKMVDLQNKADDIENELDKQNQQVKSQTIALEVLQNIATSQSQALEENRVAQEQLISLGHSQQQELIQGLEQLKKDHDHLAEKSRTILAAQETFESKQSTTFLAIEKLSSLHNAYVLEARLLKSLFLYFMIIILLHMLTSTRQTYSIRSMLYIELGITCLIEILVIRYGNGIAQQWIIGNIRLLFLILASCQLVYAIYTYRDYESLNHQMLRSLVNKVNKLRNKQLYHDDDDDYDDDVDWSSWIDSDITEDELDDVEYVHPKGVPETSIITTSSRNYNLRSRR